MASPEEQQITEQDESPPQELEGVANEGTAPLDLIEWFNSAVKQRNLEKSDLTICEGYLKEFNELFEELQEKKVGLFAICSGPQEEVDQAVKDWELHYQCLSDPTQVLRNYLSEQGLITIRISDYRGYTYGYTQPGVLCVKPDKGVLYAWAINPSFININGASDRPVPRDIWKIVQAKLADPENADKIQHSRIRTRGMFSICTIS